MAHLKKRKLEAESATAKTKLQQLSTVNSKKLGVQTGISQEMETADAAAKRRRKSVRDDDLRKPVDNDSSKNIPLPQKKRAFTSGNSGSPARKSSKNCEEPEDDETLIRETEAALKSLSGSWPGPRGSLYQRGNSDEDRYESNFENLFEEKKDNPKLSPSSMSTSSTTSNETGYSLKDVISLRCQDRTIRSQQQIKQFEPSKQYSSKNKKDLDNTTKFENDSTIHSSQNHNEVLKSRSINGRLVKSDKGTDKYSRYEPPDFNELVDESSNELEIDMSDPAVDKEDGDRDKSSEREDRICKNGPSPNSLKHHQQQMYNYQRQYSDSGIKVASSVTSTASPVSTVGSPFSATSAFRPPNTDHSKSNCRGTSTIGATNIPPMGPYPASATFVGYPSPGPVMPAPHPITVIPPSAEEKHTASVSLLQLKSPKEEVHPIQLEVPSNPVTANKSPTTGLSSVGSPDANSKQYTILQPAGVGSRAASAIQDIAREGVVSVSAVSSSSAGSNSSTGSNGSTNNTSGNNKTSSSSSVSNTANGSSSTPNATNGSSNSNGNSNNITITSITTTNTTTSPTDAGDVSTTTGTTQQEAVMKISERTASYESNRPPMSMSPTSLSRGEYHEL